MHTEANTTTRNQTTPAPVRFQLGHIYATPGALDAISDAGQSPQDFINQHARLERGELCDEDYRENLFSVDKPLRIFSAYKTARGVKIWIISEADRSATTLLLPSEY